MPSWLVLGATVSPDLVSRLVVFAVLAASPECTFYAIFVWLFFYVARAIISLYDVTRLVDAVC